MDKTTEKAHVMGINVMSYPRKLTGHCNSNTCNIVTPPTELWCQPASESRPPAAPSHTAVTQETQSPPTLCTGHCTAIQCCAVLQSCAVRYSAIQCTDCSAVQCVLCNTNQCCAVLCGGVHWKEKSPIIIFLWYVICTFSYTCIYVSL